jgi:hypothetical protein
MAPRDRQARNARPSSVLAWIAASSSEAYQFARRRRMRSLRLTAIERETCSGELAEQYALGRIDDDELDRRVDLLHRSVTHGDLERVFAGLPMPPFYAPVRSGRWRWLVFAVAVWAAAPFVFLGLVLTAGGREVAAVLFGLPAFVWVIFWWRWASVDRASGSLSRRR